MELNFVGHLRKFLATGAYSGYLPKAPGTWGTLAAIPLYLLLSPLEWHLYAITTVAFIFLSIWAADFGSVYFEREDPPKVVIDEVAGYLVTMAFHEPTVYSVVAGFFLFRIFDIWKPWPVRYFEKRFSKGLGIVLDDVMAGVYSNVCLWLIVLVIPADVSGNLVK